MHKEILSISGCRYFITFNNTLILPDPEPPLKFYKDSQEYKTDLNYDLVRVVDHNFSSLVSL